MYQRQLQIQNVYLDRRNGSSDGNSALEQLAGLVGGVVFAIWMIIRIFLTIFSVLGKLTGEREHSVAAGVALVACVALMALATAGGWYVGWRAFRYEPAKAGALIAATALLASMALYFFAFDPMKDRLAQSLRGGMVESVEHPERQPPTPNPALAPVPPLGENDDTLPAFKFAPCRGKAPDLLTPDLGADGCSGFR